MSTPASERTYRLPPRDQAGWILGLGALQCVTIALSILVTTIAVNAGVPLLAACTPVLVGGAIAFARVQGRPVHELVPVGARWLGVVAGRQHRWTVPVPLVSDTAGRSAPLPPFLDGIELLELSTPWTRQLRLGDVALIADRAWHTLTAVIPVQGGGFGLDDPDVQVRLLDAWGDVLGGFCRERTVVSRVGWTEWSAPVGLAEHVAYLETEAAASAESSARGDYDRLLETAGPETTTHEVLMTVTVDRRLVATPRNAARADDRLADVLLEEVRLLGIRLADAGLRPGAPISASELRRALRVRLDPSVLESMGPRARALRGDSLVSSHNFGPVAVTASFSDIRVDDAWHRTFWVAEWPRHELAPAWMESLVLHSATVRTVAMVYEPVAPSRSQRDVNRDATRHASDDDQRARRGFRTGARHHRARAAVLEREAELVAGYAELEYAGFLSVSAETSEALEAACSEATHAAAQAGLELRALDGQHDVALGACLPLGRFPTPRRHP